MVIVKLIRVIAWVVIAMMALGAAGSPIQVKASPEPIAQVKINELDVSEFFPNMEGTFLLRNLATGDTYIFNPGRAGMRLAPHSTFKVMNSLIGLQVKAVKDEYEIKQWDGTKREIDVWNQDHSLASALRNSVIWYYQAMARDIGEDRMQEWLAKCSYGNQDISGGIDRFWLSSSLKISPLEQLDFIQKLYFEELPFDKAVMKTVKRLMIQDETDQYILYGKTGSAVAFGWFIGFIKVKDQSYAFVTNLDTSGGGGKAKKITTAILKKQGLMPE